MFALAIASLTTSTANAGYQLHCSGKLYCHINCSANSDASDNGYGSCRLANKFNTNHDGLLGFEHNPNWWALHNNAHSSCCSISIGCTNGQGQANEAAPLVESTIPMSNSDSNGDSELAALPSVTTPSQTLSDTISSPNIVEPAVADALPTNNDVPSVEPAQILQVPSYQSAAPPVVADVADPAPAIAPEASSLIVWSMLGTIGAAIGIVRRRQEKSIAGFTA